MDYGKCATQSTNKIITAEENKRKLIIHNPSRKVIRKIKVDGCLPINSGLRCDYLFEIDTNTFIDAPVSKIDRVIYLELKGCDIEKAYKQLVATIELFITEHQGTKRECYIVASRVPSADTTVANLRAEMMRNKKVKLTVKNNQAEVNI
ncbi:MAG: hypothetical protein RIQ94_2982 [Pseudomonadota bacterium]|jgi:hypothetical protein